MQLAPCSRGYTLDGYSSLEIGLPRWYDDAISEQKARTDKKSTFEILAWFGNLYQAHIIVHIIHEIRRSIEINSYEDGMLILGQNDIFCGHHVVKFFIVISPTDSFQILGC